MSASYSLSCVLLNTKDSSWLFANTHANTHANLLGKILDFGPCQSQFLSLARIINMGPTGKTSDFDADSINFVCFSATPKDHSFSDENVDFNHEGSSFSMQQWRVVQHR